jgi:tetratricopeptide (TPR) repeat protein
MTRTLAAFVFVASLGMLSPHANAQSIERIFSAANEAYFHGELARATELYQRLIDAGVRDPDVYFNLATAHARLGHLGSALLGFERALWLRPGDELAEQELSAVRSLLGRRRAEREGQATVQARPPLFEALVRPLSADLLAGLLLALDALLFGLLLARTWVKREALKLGLAISLPLLGLVLLASAAGMLVKLEAFKDGAAAIVVRDGAELREGPDPHAQVRAAAHEGQAARLLRREEGFAHVQLDGGDRGWMNTKDLGAIRPD